jgi:hypothetical protein
MAWWRIVGPFLVLSASARAAAFFVKRRRMSSSSSGDTGVPAAAEGSAWVRTFTVPHVHVTDVDDVVQVQLDVLDAVLATIDRMPPLIEESSHLFRLSKAVATAIDLQKGELEEDRPLDGLEGLHDVCARHGWNGRQFTTPVEAKALRTDVNKNRMFLAMNT